MVGNHSQSVKAQGSLTARPTSRAGTKVGLSDPVVPHGRAIAQRIKATPGITGLSPPRVHIDGEVWHLDVGSSHPGAVVGPKGWAVRPLKRYAIWVQNVESLRLLRVIEGCISANIGGTRRQQADAGGAIPREVGRSRA